jgi:hypothetical protein
MSRLNEPLSVRTVKPFFPVMQESPAIVISGGMMSMMFPLSASATKRCRVFREFISLDPRDLFRRGDNHAHEDPLFLVFEPSPEGNTQFFIFLEKHGFSPIVRAPDHLRDAPLYSIISQYPGIGKLNTQVRAAAAVFFFESSPEPGYNNA